MTGDIDLALVCGARPNFIKIAPIHRAIGREGRLRHVVVHTGQHHDFQMSQVFFDQLDLPQPDVYLGASSGTHAEQTGRIMLEFERFLIARRPRLVVVVGDVNSTLACSLAAAKLGVPVAHVEAGLRSWDRSMPEEINRIVTDALSAILYTSCDDGTVNLLREGVSADRIRQVGNVMIDTLLRYRQQAESIPLPRDLEPGRYALVTLHRPANVDVPQRLRHISRILEDTARLLPVVFPVHPRTRRHLDDAGLGAALESAGVRLASPQSYLQFLGLMSRATIVLTDSGGVQEETTVLGVPCLTLRDNTERPVTVEVGTNVVIGLDRPAIETAVRSAVDGRGKRGRSPAGWDGKAADRIVEHLTEVLEDGEPRLAAVCDR